MDDSVVLVHGGAAVELLAAGGAGHVIVHVDVHVHRLHVALEVELPEKGAPAKVALVVLHLVVLKNLKYSTFIFLLAKHKKHVKGTTKQFVKTIFCF
jgi:hypothetical protein